MKFIQTWQVNYNATYYVEAETEDQAIDVAMERHSQLPDGDWEADLYPPILNKTPALLEEIEKHRAKWAQVGVENGWKRDPLFIQVWIDEAGQIVDSVYLPEGADCDVVAPYEDWAAKW
jgi:hypothetical protein